MHAATLDAVENLPTAQAVQTLAPALAPVFVIQPALHSMQSLVSFDPVLPVYRPASQSMHATMLDDIEYLPTAQAIHVVAPVPAPVSVIEPAVQLVHDAKVDAVEYLPAAHAVHVLAPAPVPVLVIEPARHTLQ